MKVLVVYGHPNPASFNNGIKETVIKAAESKGHEVQVRDLYALNFNPILSGADFATFQSGSIPSDIKVEQDFISWADVLVFVYPIWWIGRPAIVQGYIDRIFSFGFAFSYDQNGPKGLLTVQKAIVINTAGSPEFNYDSWPNSKELLSRPMDEGTLMFSGIKSVTHKIYYGINISTPEERAGYLTEIETIIDGL
jgi:NAD(P)H dehydrogenase (quinone)